MNNHDQLISKVFFKDNRLNLLISNKLLKNLYNYKYINILNYLKNRYNDSKSRRETLYRIKYHIENIPKCPICGKQLSFVGKGDLIFKKYCSNSCRAKDSKNYNKWVEGQKKYNKEHYGVEYVWQRNDFKTKRKEKLINKYGTTKLYTIPEIKEKIDKSIRLKINEILLHRNETLKKNYGISSFSELISLPEIQEKINNTKRKNHSFNSSKPENESYQLLKKKFPDIIYQYRSKQYPFNCDFYIPSLDLYIECNYHWTHGYKIFENTKEDNDKLNKWKNKNTKFYQNAINTWTIRDPKKRQIAKENNLNWIEFFNINELKKWLNNK